MEREQERVVRVHELQERKHERKVRKEEREERELEPEERRRESEERVRNGGVHCVGQRIGKKDIGFGIKKRGDEPQGGITYEPFDVT